MINRIARMFLGKFEKTVYDAAVANGLTTSTFYSSHFPDFIVKVNDVRVKVEVDRIEVAQQYLPRNSVLYWLLKRVYKQKRRAEKNRQAKQAYQNALDAIKANDKK